MIGLIMLIGFSSCTNTEKEGKKARREQGEDIIRPEKDSYDEEMVLFLLPSPGEIIERFKEANITYVKEFTNPVSNSSNYIDLQTQSLNLGIYIADMAYSSVFTRFNEAIEYLGIIQTLANEINISSSAFESLSERLKANVGNMDSLIQISNDAFYNMIEFLETGGKENIISLIAAGAYLESMYIALSCIEEFDEENEILKQIIDLKYPLDNLRERTAIIDNDPNIIQTIAFLNEIESIFSEFNVIDEPMVVKETNDGGITLGGGELIRLNEEDFLLLKNKIMEMRNSIVEILLNN